MEPQGWVIDSRLGLREQEEDQVISLVIIWWSGQRHGTQVNLPKLVGMDNYRTMFELWGAALCMGSGCRMNTQHSSVSSAGWERFPARETTESAPHGGLSQRLYGPSKGPLWNQGSEKFPEGWRVMGRECSGTQRRCGRGMFWNPAVLWEENVLEPRWQKKAMTGPPQMRLLPVRGNPFLKPRIPCSCSIFSIHGPAPDLLPSQIQNNWGTQMCPMNIPISCKFWVERCSQVGLRHSMMHRCGGKPLSPWPPSSLVIFLSNSHGSLHPGLLI